MDVETFNDQLIYEPGSLKTGQGNPYTVFTPFKRKWIENFQVEFLDIEYEYKTKIKLNSSSNIKDFDFNYIKTHQVNMEQWPAGENEAVKRLHGFLDDKVLDYSKNRNDPILEGTSRFHHILL